MICRTMYVIWVLGIHTCVWIPCSVRSQFIESLMAPSASNTLKRTPLTHPSGNKFFISDFSGPTILCVQGILLPPPPSPIMQNQHKHGGLCPQKPDIRYKYRGSTLLIMTYNNNITRDNSQKVNISCFFQTLDPKSP